MADEIQKMLVISTSHMPEAIARWQNMPDAFVLIPHEYGWMLSTDTHVFDTAETGEVSGSEQALKDVCEYAKKLDCQWVRFDADADENENLKTWEW
jgi:hypothetical protein